jgi:hypothetical protein
VCVKQKLEHAFRIIVLAITVQADQPTLFGWLPYKGAGSLQDVLFFSWGWVRLSPLGTSATNWSIVPAPDDRWWWMWSIGGMRIGRRNRSTRRKPAPVPLCPPQIQHELTWARTRAGAVGIRRLTAWVMARSEMHSFSTF